MGSEDQSLTVQSNKIRTNHHRVRNSHQKRNTRKSNKDLSKYIFYICDERGHLAIDFPRNKDRSTRGRETRKNIMLMLHKMMILPRRESNKIVMKNMS